MSHYFEVVVYLPMMLSSEIKHPHRFIDIVLI